jgi:sulfoxide reductase heme-binding subunit YedZ
VRAPFSLLFGWPHLRAGLLALCVLVALLLSSFPSLVRLLGLRTWKELHRLAYVAALLVLQHVLLAPFAPRATVLLLFALAAGVGLLRWLPRPPGDHTSSGMPDSTQKRSSTPL